MANGILGKAALLATTDTTLYTVPADTFSVVTVNVVNRSTQARSVRIALADAATPLAEEYVEYDVEITANGAIERGGIVIGAGTNVVVYANSTEVTAMVYGIETSTV
jgi:hypothetical protein